MARYEFRKSYSLTSERMKFGECSGVCVKRRSNDQALGTSASTTSPLLQPRYSQAAETAGDFGHLGLRERLALLDRLAHRA
jgi:hypothetical protein